MPKKAVHDADSSRCVTFTKGHSEYSYTPTLAATQRPASGSRSAGAASGAGERAGDGVGGRKGVGVAGGRLTTMRTGLRLGGGGGVWVWLGDWLGG